MISLDAGISARHLSCVETGKAQPSREIIARLAIEYILDQQEPYPAFVMNRCWDVLQAAGSWSEMFAKPADYMSINHLFDVIGSHHH